MQKRALPPRHSALTDAVQAILEKQAQIHEPCIDPDTVLHLTSSTKELSACHPHSPPPTAPLIAPSYPKPIFRILPRSARPGVRKKSAASEPPSDDYYLWRHRKHELEEKKLKNREKELLEHELYQQRLFVEKIKSLDRSTLASILSSLRQEGEDNVDRVDIDDLQRQLLKEAKDRLHRYEMLGLGRSGGTRN